MPIARLDDRAVIAVTGPEARPFLQGLITNDIENVAPGRAIYAALLTPQGKVLFDFLVAEGDGALLLDCARSSRDALARRLSMYKLRARVAIEPRDQLEVLAEWNGDRAKYAITFDDPRLPALGRRAIGAAGEMPASVADAGLYRARRLELGIPEAADFGSDRMFALDADLDELHAIAFGKGCYVGQELTARMKHRGTARKRLLPIESVSGSDLPVRDTSVTAAGKEIGDIASAYGARGFAQIRLDRLDEAGDVPIQAGEAAVKIRRPDWLFS
jgi:hypothetical protein